VNDVPALGLVLDCHDPEGLAPFWADALGYVTLGGVENYVLLVPDGRPGPKLLLQRVPEAKAGKNRMHLDIEVPDIEAVAGRLEASGATRVSSGVESEHGSSWIVMNDPEGNEFCVCDGGSGS
jgi:predicted enzyme related to lactoylglutathione lyase